MARLFVRDRIFTHYRFIEANENLSKKVSCITLKVIDYESQIGNIDLLKRLGEI